jgi:glycosyltransferase involved in cell wall biosynthesis
MDTRDPWRFVERLPEAIASPVWLGVSRFFEERCVSEAALVVTNTEPAAELMRRTYPGEGPFLAVRNGSDLVRPVAGSRSGAFIVAFAGSIYLDRDPRPLFEAAARLVSRRGLTPEDLRIVLVGNVQEYDGRPVRELAASAGIADHVDLFASVPREELVAILEKASILFSLPQDSHLAIPSKIYEYAEYPAWVLAVADPQSATGELLAETGADVVEPGSSAGIFEILDRRYSDYLAGRQPRALAEDPRFLRSTQAKRLLTALKAITGSGQSPFTTSP